MRTKGMRRRPRRPATTPYTTASQLRQKPLCRHFSPSAFEPPRQGLLRSQQGVSCKTRSFAQINTLAAFCKTEFVGTAETISST